MRIRPLEPVLVVCFLAAVMPAAQQPAFQAAVRAGDVAAVEAMVAKKPALVAARDEAGRTALHVAAAAGRVDVAALLVARGADVDAADHAGSTPLHLAASSGHDEIGRLLIENKAAIDVRCSAGETPLAKACARGRVKVAARLLAAGASVESSNTYGRTPLLLVARESGNAELAGILLDRKANPGATDKFGDTPLTLAAWRGFRPLVDLLLERGADIPSDGPGRNRLLRRAASEGLEKLFSRLLEAGDLPAGRPGTRSLLHEAASGGSVAVLTRVLEEKPDLDQPDEDGWTPLHDAAFMARLDAVKILLKRRADPNRRNRLGQSAWNLAVEHERTEAADLLAAHGADRGAPRFPTLTGEYLGQAPPGRVPQAFAPGLLGGHLQLHSSVVFSPDGLEAYWSESVPPTTPGYSTGRTMVSRRLGDRWTYPQVAMVGSKRLEDVPIVSADGKRIYDMARRPLPGQAAAKENIWVADRVGEAWGEPRPLDGPVNAPPHHWQFALDKDGGVYFSSTWKDARGLFFSRLVNGRYTEAIPLGPPINTTGGESMPFVARDGSYLLFSRSYDIWVSFRGEGGAWMKPIALPATVNTPDVEICPVASPDGRYLFFLRGGPHWVDAAVIEDLRPKGK